MHINNKLQNAVSCLLSGRTITSRDAWTDAGTVSRAEWGVGIGLLQTPIHACRQARSNKSSRDAGPVQ